MSPDPTIVRRQVVIANAMGLHMRPALKFTQLARTFQSDVRVYGNGQEINGKNILDLTMLAAECGTPLDVEARGADAEAAVQALVDLVLAHFHETAEGLEKDAEH